MINEKELRISNKSYINKDFASIYPEIIDFIKTLTNRYDPEASNESDPGIVIAKLMAFITDKLGYNIDKNVLENFLLSATQESSVRKLCDMLGYSMRYYVAPETKLTLTYIGELNTPITFDALSTVFTSKEEESDISFIATQRAEISKQNEAVTCPVIQGLLKELQVNTSGDVTTGENKPLIQLENLDDNNRVYFPEVNVAENGVFIVTNVISNEYWQKVNFLNDVAPLTPCFKFGFDSAKGLPYIEFPKDIASLIGNGLYIRYVLTSGLNGNVGANTINALDSTTSQSWNALVESDESAADNLYVRNYSATINGADPETISETYNNYKKTICTFNTLTTTRDYANAIYNTYASDETPLVSNVQVSDRRDDINYTKKVKSYDELGEVILNLTDATNLNAFQLCCYPFATMTAVDKNQFEQSFLPLTNAGRSLTSEIEGEIEKYKTISHDYKVLAADDIYAIKNKLTLNGGLVTDYKVNAYETVEIDKNVIYQLIRDFNSRNVDYGYEIPYDSLVNSITKADKRISYVSLMEPELTTYVLKRNGTEVPLVSESGAPYYTSLLAKNILAGKVSLFDYDDRFNFELGQAEITGKSMVNEKVENITTSLTLTLTNGVESKLYKNEAIQFISPSVITELTYPAYCYFRFVSTNHDKDHPVVANTIYELQDGEFLYMGYTENDIWKVIKYEKGQIIKPVGFNLFNTPNDNTQYSTIGRTVYHKTNDKSASSNDEWFFSLTAQESIEMQKVNSVTLNKKTKCYWLRNNASNKLFTNDEWISGVGGKTMLKENEYFFYTDAAETQLVALGSGTTIESGLSSLEDITAEVVDLSEVLDKGMLALKDKWKVLSFNTTTTMNIQENTILTLAEGDSLTMSNAASTFTITSTLASLPTGATFVYSIAGEADEPLDNVQITAGGWQVMSRLHVNVSKDEPQIINEDVEGTISSTRQSVSFKLEGNATPVVLDTQGQHFNLNTEMHNEGGIIDTSIIVDEVPTYPVSAYCYDVALTTDSEEQTPERNLQGYVSYPLTTSGAETYTFSLPKVKTGTDNEDAVLMAYVYVTGGTGEVTASVTGTEYNIQAYNPSSPNYVTSYDLSEGINVIDIHRLSGGSGACSITFTNTGINGYIVLGTLDFYTDLNEALGIDDFVAEAGGTTSKAGIIADLMSKIRESKFYYNCKIGNESAIESNNLMSPYAFYDANNIANKFTTSQIDFDTSKIDVLKSSRQ